MIVFTHATKQFANGSYGIQDVSFTVDPGEFLFVTGKSGSGKTTLMKLLTREYSLSDGDILVDTISLATLKSNQVYRHRRKIGIVYQDYLLLPDLNVWENIALPLSVHGKTTIEIESRVTDLLKLVKLTDKAMAFPSELSGGEAQRISIARALATGPEIIFADEPTGNLDAENTKHIAALLRRINQLGTTIICATHDLSLLDHVDQASHIELENGQVSNHTRSTKVHSDHVKNRLDTEPESIEESDIDQPTKGKTSAKKSSEVHHDHTHTKTGKNSEHELNSETFSVDTLDTQHQPDSEHSTTKQSWWSSLFGKKSSSVSPTSTVDAQQPEHSNDEESETITDTADSVEEDVPSESTEKKANKPDKDSSHASSQAKKKSKHSHQVDTKEES